MCIRKARLKKKVLMYIKNTIFLFLYLLQYFDIKKSAIDFVLLSDEDTNESWTKWDEQLARELKAEMTLNNQELIDILEELNKTRRN